MSRTVDRVAMVTFAAGELALATAGLLALWVSAWPMALTGMCLAALGIGLLMATARPPASAQAMLPAGRAAAATAYPAPARPSVAVLKPFVAAPIASSTPTGAPPPPPKSQLGRASLAAIPRTRSSAPPPAPPPSDRVPLSDRIGPLAGRVASPAVASVPSVPVTGSAAPDSSAPAPAGLYAVAQPQAASRRVSSVPPPAIPLPTIGTRRSSAPPASTRRPKKGARAWDQSERPPRAYYLPA